MSFLATSPRSGNGPHLSGMAGRFPTLTAPSPFEQDAGLWQSVLVFSHLRWDFVFQRPQHLLTRCAAEKTVYYFEEPVFGEEGGEASASISPRGNGVQVVVPKLPAGLDETAITHHLKVLVDRLLRDEKVSNYLLWYYTPMALEFSGHLEPAGIVYDCMDELSLFKGAHPRLLPLEQELFRRADVVFTGGQSLYQYKRDHHPNIHPFPSSIDARHFGRARQSGEDGPPDQECLPGPKIGFFGVVDERMDLSLVEAIAAAHPEWSIILLGPVVKVDPASLPRRANLHYLGPKSYDELPDYIRGWDVAILPFALNDSTRFISPTKTPEYLAAGLPVVSTAITDVVSPYGELGLVSIGSTPEEFVGAIEHQLIAGASDREEWLRKVDHFLDGLSWDSTWNRMFDKVKQAMAHRTALRPQRKSPASPVPLPPPSSGKIVPLKSPARRSS